MKKYVRLVYQYNRIAKKKKKKKKKKEKKERKKY